MLKLSTKELMRRNDAQLQRTDTPTATEPDEKESKRKTTKELVEGEQSSSGRKSTMDLVYESDAAELYDNISKRVNAWGNQASYWMKKHNTRSEKYGQDGYRADYGDWHGTVSDAYSSMQREEDEIRAYIDKYGKYIDPEWTKSVLKYVDSGHSTLEGIYKSASFEKDYFSKWKDEKSYLKDLDAQKAYEAEQAELAKPIGVLEADLSALEREFAKWESTAEYDWTDTNQRKEYTEKYEEYKQQIEQKKKLVERAEKHQKYSVLPNMPDWEENSQYNPDIDDSVAYLFNTAIAGRTEAGVSADQWKPSELFGHYSYIEPGEAANYFYLLNAEGKSAAQEYYDYIEEDLNQRKGYADYKNMSGLEKALYWIPAGFDQFGSGVAQLFSKEQLPTSSTQFTSALIRDEAYDTWKGLGYLYDTGTTVGNMLPSIAVSAMTGNPVLGTVTMGASASGNAYNQALKEGYSTGEAAAYGMLVGISEASLQSILGGVSKLSGGGNVTSKVMSKVSQIDKMLPRLAAKYAVALGGEILEEELQLFLEPAIKTIIMGEDYDAPEIEEILETALITALSTGALESPGIIGGEVKTYSTGKAITGTENGLTGLKQLSGDLYSAASPELKTKVDSLTQKVDKSKGRQQAWNAANLYSTVGEMATQANVNDISKSLVRKGFSETEANKIAGAIVASANGVSLTKEQSKLLKSVEKDERVQQTIADLIKNQSSTVRQTQDKLHQFEAGVYMENAAQRMKKSQDTKGTTESQDVAETQNEVQPAQQETSEVGISEDGVTRQVSTGKAITPKKIVSLNGSKAMVETDNGTIPADDIQFGSADADLLWRNAMQFNGIDAPGVNGVIRAYRAGDPVATYLQGAAQEFKNGYNNMQSGGRYADKLTSAQRAIIYELGQKAAGAAVAKQQADKKAAADAKVQKTGNVYYGYEGSTMEERQKTGNKLHGMQSVAVDFAQRLAKSRGITFYFYESYVDKDGTRVYKDRNGKIVKAENGFYDSKDGSIHIDLNAGSYGRGSVLFTVAHELTHFIQDWSPKHYKQLCNILMKGYAAKGQSVDELVANQQAFAKEHGRELSWEEAYDEVIADSMEGILADGKVMELMRDIEAVDQTLGEKVKQFFRDICDLLKRTIRVYSNVKPDSAEGRMVQGMQEIYDQMQQLFAEGLYEGGDNYRKAEKNTTADGGVKMMSREEGNRIKEQISAASIELNRMEVAVSVTTEGFAGMRKSDIAKAVDAEFSKFGNQVDRQNFGIILLEFQQINKALNYLNTDGEKAALLTVHRVLKRGIIVDSHTEHKERSADSFTIAAPVEINGKRGNVGVVVQRVTGTNRFKTLRILLPNGKAFEFVQNKKADPTTGSSSKPKNLEGIPIESASKSSIRNESGNVKKNDSAKSDTVKLSARKGETAEKASPVKPKFNYVTETQQFRRWFGDWLKHPKTASKIVDADGTPKVMYHGSPAQFTIFDKKKARSSGAYGSGFYFTDSQSHASTYGQQYSVYLNIRNPLQYGGGTVSREQVRQFLEAVAENEDYSIENYGTYDVDSIVQNIIGRESKADAFKVIQDVSATAVGDMVEAVELFNKVNGTKYDGVVTATETVAFYPEQIKSATDNIGTFDGGNPDIRFSARKGENDAAQAVLEQENAQLRENISHLKELLKLQRTVTNGTKFTKTSVEAAARMLKKNANAKGDTAELSKLLNSFYEHIATYRELSWESVKENAWPVVNWLQDHVDIKPQRSEYAQDILSHLRGSRIYLDESQKAEAAHRFGSFDAYRKSMMGSVIITNSAKSSLDSLWQELSAMYPDIFDAEITAADQPLELSDAVYRLRNSDTSALEYEYNREFIAMDLLQQVYDSYWRVSTLRTFADVNQAKINRLKGEHYQRMSKLREDNQLKIQKLKDEHRIRLDHIRKWYQEQVERKQEEIAERYRESWEEATEAEAVEKNRSVVKKRIKALMNMLAHPTKDLHVPIALQGPLQEFLDSIDFTSVTNKNGKIMTVRHVSYTRALLEVRNAVAGQRTAMKNDAEDDGVFALDVPGNFLEEIDKHITAVNNATKGLDLTTNRVYDMSSAELHDLGYILGVINKSIRDIDKLHMAGAKARVSELGQSTLREMKGRKKVDSKTGSRAMWANYIPWHAFRRMGTAAQQVFKGLMQGQAKLAKTANAVIKFAEKTYKSDEVKSWESERHTIKLDSGETVVMTPAQIMSFYCLSSRKHGIGHLVGGGIHIDTVKRAGREKELNQTDDFLLTENDIANINSHLTERQIEVANALQQYMQRLGGKLLNEISMARWDFMQATEEDYFPIKTMDTGRDARGPEQDKANLWALLNKSFTKGLTEGANNTVIIGSVFDVFAEHMSQVAEYNAFALPLVDAMRWFNYRERIQIDDKQIKDIGVKRSIRDTLGTAAEKYFIDLMLDINSSQKAGRHEDLFAKILSRSKVAAVGWNLRVAIQQPTAILRASLILDMPSLLQGAVRIGSKELVKEMQKYSGVALWKSMGYYDLNISRGLTEQIKRDKSRLDKVNDAGMWLPGKMDEITWARIWAATKEKLSKEQNLTGEELLQATADLFEDVVYQTQVADSVLTRSSNMRSKVQMMREATSFMAEATLSFNILLSAFQDYERGHSTWYKVKRGLMIGFCGYVLPSVANALVTALIDAWRDDDEYEEFYEKYLQALFGEKGFFDGNLFSELNPPEKVIFVKDAISALKGYRLSTSYGELIEDTVGLYDTFAKILSGKKKLDYNTVYSALQVFGNVVGFGSSNIAREVVGIWNNTFGKLYDKPIHRTEINDRSKIKNAYTTGALTQKEAMQALVEYGVVDTEDDAYFIVKEWANGADYSKYGDLYDAVLSGRSIDKAMKELIDHGCDEDDVVNQIRSQVRKWYKNSEISKKRAADMLVKYTDLDEDDAMLKTDYWEWQTQNPGFKELSESAYIQYTEICEPIGIELGVFYDCWHFFNETTADYNSNGKPIPDSKKKKVKAYIYGLDIPVNQKRILLACWYN